MINLFNKKNNKKIQTIFPSSKNMLEATSKNWPTKSDEEILKEIYSRSIRGERHVYFFNAIISKQTIKELRHQGYRVTSSTFDGAPCFKIYW